MRASFALIALFVISILPTVTLAQSDEAVFWQSVSGSSDGAEFCAYLEAFPNGKFVALAKLRAKKLGVSCGESQASPAPTAPKPAPAPAPTRTAKPKPAQPAPKVPDSPFAMTGMKGWLETPEDIFKAFRLNEGGVAVKWTGGYCTMMQGANTAKSVSGLERADTAYDLFDSNGSVGIWTGRPKDLSEET